jgi:hypothetical protein
LITCCSGVSLPGRITVAFALAPSAVKATPARNDLIDFTDAPVEIADDTRRHAFMGASTVPFNQINDLNKRSGRNVKKFDTHRSIGHVKPPAAAPRP